MTVWFYDDAGDYLTSSTTDSSGVYSNYNGLVTGSYHVRTWNDLGYINELYDDKPCVGGCTISEGTPITVTLGSTSDGIDLALGQSVFADGFESGDHSEWSRTVP